MKKKLILFINIKFRKVKSKERTIINEIPKKRVYKKKLLSILI